MKSTVWPPVNVRLTAVDPTVSSFFVEPLNVVVPPLLPVTETPPPVSLPSLIAPERVTPPAVRPLTLADRPLPLLIVPP